MENAHTVLFQEQSIVNEIVHRQHSLLATHAAHVKLRTEMQLLLIHCIARFLTHKGRHLRHRRLLHGSRRHLQTVQRHSRRHHAKQHAHRFPIDGLHASHAVLSFDAHIAAHFHLRFRHHHRLRIILLRDGTEQRTDGSLRLLVFLLALLAAANLIHLARNSIILLLLLARLHFLTESLEFLTRLLRAFLLRLTFANGTNGVFDGSIRSLQHTLSFLTRIGEHLLLLLRKRGEFLFVVRNGLLEFLLAVVDVLTLILPIHLVSHNVLEILVAHHIVLAHQISCIANHIFGKTNFARNLHRKRTTGIAYLQHKEGLHL